MGPSAAPTEFTMELAHVETHAFIAPVSGQYARNGVGARFFFPKSAHLLRGQGKGDPLGYIKAHSVPSPSSLARSREQRTVKVTSHIWRERGR